MHYNKRLIRIFPVLLLHQVRSVQCCGPHSKTVKWRMVIQQRWSPLWCWNAYFWQL